jgi:hypothetical protein
MRLYQGEAHLTGARSAFPFFRPCLHRASRHPHHASRFSLTTGTACMHIQHCTTALTPLRSPEHAAAFHVTSSHVSLCDSRFRQATALLDGDDGDDAATAASEGAVQRLEAVLTRFCSDMCAAIDSGVPPAAVTRLGTLKFLGDILSDNKKGFGAATSATIGAVSALVQRLMHPDTADACRDSGLMGSLILSMDFVFAANDAVKLCKSVHTFAARLPDTAVTQLKYKAAARLQSLIIRFDGDARVMSAACKAVAALACSDVFRKAAMECGLARDCARSCTQEKEAYVLNGCMAVSQLSVLPSVACALADAGSVWPLAAVLQRCHTPLVIKHAAGALRNLCSSSDRAREQLLSSGGLQAAARIMVEGRNLGSQLLANVAGLLWCVPFLRALCFCDNVNCEQVQLQARRQQAARAAARGVRRRGSRCRAGAGRGRGRVHATSCGHRADAAAGVYGAGELGALVRARRQRGQPAVLLLQLHLDCGGGAGHTQPPAVPARPRPHQ